MYVQGSLVEIQTPTHCNVIDSSVNTSRRVVAQQYSSDTSICALFFGGGAHVKMLLLHFLICFEVA